MPKIDLSGLKERIRKSYDMNAPKIKRTASRTSSAVRSSLENLVDNSAKAGGYAVAAASGAYSRMGEFAEQHPASYNSLAAGAKGLGTIVAFHFIEAFTPDVIDKILEVPEYYAASLAAATSLKKISNGKIRFALTALVPAIGGMASYHEASNLAGQAASTISANLGNYITNLFHNGKWLAFGLIGKHSLDSAAESEKLVEGRRVKVRPSQQYRSIDTGLNTIIIYGGTKLFSDESLAYFFNAPQEMYIPVSHALAGVAAYNYSVNSSRMPKPAKFAAKLIVPAVAGYFIAESVGDSLYQNSAALQSFGRWLMDEGKFYSAAISSGATQLMKNTKIRYAKMHQNPQK